MRLVGRLQFIRPNDDSSWVFKCVHKVDVRALTFRSVEFITKTAIIVIFLSVVVKLAVGRTYDQKVILSGGRTEVGQIKVDAVKRKAARACHAHQLQGFPP